MQDRFVGDIGDFGKYGLLRALTGLWDWERGGPLPEHKRLSLGVVWCVPDEMTIAKTPASHGQHVGYLFNSLAQNLYRNCDPPLFDCIKEIVCGDRSLKSIAESGIIGGKEGEFIPDPIPRNSEQRQQWLEKAVKEIEESSIVFLDPDIGLTPPSKRNSTKHVRPREVSEFSDHNRSVVIYQSFARKTLSVQIEDWKRQLDSTLISQREFRVLKFKSRAFIVLPSDRHSEMIDKRLAKMLKGPWHPHFECYPGG